MLGVRGRQYDLPSIWADHFEGKNRLKSFAYAGARERCRCNGAPGRLCHIRWPYACCLVLLDAVALEWHGDHAVEIATGCVEINVTFGEARANPGLAKPRRWSAAANARTAVLDRGVGSTVLLEHARWLTKDEAPFSGTIALGARSFRFCPCKADIRRFVISQ